MRCVLNDLCVFDLKGNTVISWTINEINYFKDRFIKICLQFLDVVVQFSAPLNLEVVLLLLLQDSGGETSCVLRVLSNMNEIT